MLKSESLTYTNEKKKNENLLACLSGPVTGIRPGPEVKKGGPLAEQSDARRGQSAQVLLGRWFRDKRPRDFLNI